MYRAYLVENLWNGFIVPVFIERFLLVVCAAAFYGMVITNTMSFNGLQRIGLGCALVGIALFLGATAYKQTQPKVSTLPTTINQPAPAPATITTSGPQSPVVTGNANTVTIQDSLPAKKDPAQDRMGDKP